MVKKLLGYEIKYYLKIVVFYLPVTILMGLLVRFVQFFKIDHYIYDFLFSSSILLLYIGSAVTLIATLVLAVVRFYKNLYSAEGYLTFSLPINNHQIIISKIIGYVIFQAISVVAVIIGWCIAFIGVKEVWSVVGNIFSLFGQIPNKVHLALFILEIIILIALSSLVNPLLYYSCITLGQIAKKHKILFSIGIYYGYTIIVQVLATAFSIVIMLMGTAGAFESLSIWIGNHPYAALHIFFCTTIIAFVGIGALFYFITYRIMTNKLNLE